MVTKLKNKLMISLLHKKKTINLNQKEKITLMKSQAYFWTKKNQVKLNTNVLSTKLIYIKLYAKNK